MDANEGHELSQVSLPPECSVLSKGPYLIRASFVT